MEVAPPAVARAPAAVENRLIIRGVDISWMTPPTKKECPDETTSPGRLEASGADEYSCAGRSYKTLFQSKDLVALVTGERHKALREWMQSDAKSRAAEAFEKLQKFRDTIGHSRKFKVDSTSERFPVHDEFTERFANYDDLKEIIQRNSQLLEASYRALKEMRHAKRYSLRV